MSTKIPQTRIVLADPDDVCRRIVAQRLAIAGYTVIQATDGAAALARAQNDEPHLIISELDLPVLNGKQLCRELSRGSNTSGIPVIIVSTKQMLNDKITALDAGARDYMTKPFAVSELEARIKAVLRNS